VAGTCSALYVQRKKLAEDSAARKGQSGFSTINKDACFTKENTSAQQTMMYDL
jgi:hypothetical protein